MHVAMVTTDFNPAKSGVGTHVQALARALVSYSSDTFVSVIAPATDQNAPSPTTSSSRISTHAVVRSRHPIVANSGRAEYILQIIEWTKDLLGASTTINGATLSIVHAHGFMAAPAADAIAQAHGVPWILTKHCWLEWPDQPEIMALQEWAVQASSRVITVSKSMQNLIYQNARPSRVDVIYPGTGSAALEHQTAIAPPSSSGLFTILAPGSLTRIKGWPTLLSAVERLRLPNVRVRFAGDGGFRADLEAIVRSLHIEDSVVFLGRLTPDALAVEYSKADVVVVPSRYEPFGMVVAEAMSWGIPIVGSDVGGIAEQVRDGVDGYLVSPGDAGQLTTALEVMVADPSLAARMGVSARERARSFTTANTVRQVHSVYKSLTNS